MRRMKTKAQIQEEYQKLLENYARRRSYGGPDPDAHGTTAVQAAMEALRWVTGNAPAHSDRYK